MNRQLLALLLLAGATALAAYAPRAGGLAAGAIAVRPLPEPVAGWTAIDGAPEDVLPLDPRALGSVRRTYRRGERTVWVAVARYDALNDPRRRPALDEIAETDGVRSIERQRVPLDGIAAGVLLQVAAPRRRLSLVYWYELAGTVIASEYWLRARLFVNTLFRRPRSLLLVRVASEDPRTLDDFLRTFASTLLRARATGLEVQP